MKQKKAFHEKYPVQARSTTTSSQAVAVAHPRAGGQCDYSLDGGTAPLDTTRELDLLAVSDGDFTVKQAGVMRPMKDSWNAFYLKLFFMRLQSVLFQ